MNGIIFTGGEAPEKRCIEGKISKDDYIIAADSGLEKALEYGYRPDLVVGDMDSLENTKILHEFPADCVKIFPKEKDETDTELALRFLREKNTDSIILIGGGGGRLDHLLGIVSVFDREIHPDTWYTAEEMIVSIEGEAMFSGMTGNTVSFFPAGKEICRMESSGLKWGLGGLEWEKGDAGISNIVTDDPFTIRMLSGKLIMISFLKELFG